MANPSRMKREIDKAKKEKAAEKRERRQRGPDEQDEAGTTPEGQVSVPTDEILGQLERIHAQFANEEIDFEEFERAKDALIAQLASG